MLTRYLRSQRLILSLFVLIIVTSCSKEDKGPNPVVEISSLVDTWELVAVKVDGVLSTPETDSLYRFFEDEELIELLQNGTGQSVENGVHSNIVSWKDLGDSVKIQLENDQPFTVEYALGTDTLTMYFPSDLNPDIDRLYIRSNQVISSDYLPVVTTSLVTNVTETAAQCGGNVSASGSAAVTARGVCWSTNPVPTIADSKTSNGSGTGSFTSSLTGLTSGTSYYVRAYATNSAGTGYGEEQSFTATVQSAAPVVTTSVITNITQTSAQCGGNVISNGGTTLIAGGVCWSTAPMPTIADSKTVDSIGMGTFVSYLNGLSSGIRYYVRAYATNNEGTGYGDSKSFVTLSGALVPTVTTSAVSSVTETTAQCGGTVTSDGGATVTARGVCWDTTPLPTVADSKTTDGVGTGDFVSAVTGLTGGSVYYMRAYATNSAGTGYGSSQSFSTPGALTPDSTGTVTDIDGNVYRTVKIGNQWWMAENLSVTHYRNGDSIPYVTDPNDWANRTAGGYSEYNYNSTHVATYGRLYNWYAVDDNRSVAPAGWHVPTDGEWQQLERYLGMSPSEANATLWRGTDEGGKLKDTSTYWYSPNEGATNASGFTALPGGYATDGLSFQTESYSAYFWSATSLNGSIAYSRFLNYSYSKIFRNLPVFNYGLSIRCVKD